MVITLKKKILTSAAKVKRNFQKEKKKITKGKNLILL